MIDNLITMIWLKLNSIHRKLAISSIFILVLLCLVGFITWSRANNQVKPYSPQSVEVISKKKQNTTATPQNPAEEPLTPPAKSESVVSTPTAWPVTYTLSQASSLTVVVNKKHKLPSNYVPAGLTNIQNGQLRDVTASALNSLISDASAQSYKLKVISAYRSYQSQTNIYSNYVAQSGQAAADTFSARPGHSEHQTGLAVDLGLNGGACDLETCFGTTAEGIWIAKNAQNYGFIVRYQQGKETITGYQYEPWHLRYLGIDVAKQVHSSGKTLDQFYGVEAGSY